MEQVSEVMVKGTKEGLMLQVPVEPSVDEVLSTLKEKFSNESAFFHGAELILDLGLRPFQESEFQALQEVIRSTGVKIKGILSDNPITKLMAQNEGIPLMGDRSIMSSRVRVDHPVKTQKLKSHEEAKRQPRYEKNGAGKDYGIFVNKTLRSGQKLHFIGDVTILGDVNPGAEVVAGGSIIVFGSMRGLAHAGAEGKRDVVVAALDLRPTQLRIADCIACAPEKAEGSHDAPELAKIQDEQIIIEPYIKEKR